MITQSLHFEVTGRDAEAFWRACQEKNIEPMQAFQMFLQEFTKQYQQKQDDDLRAKKLLYAGSLSHLAKSKLLDIE